jgi:hypothetical protein
MSLSPCRGSLLGCTMYTIKDYANISIGVLDGLEELGVVEL